MITLINRSFKPLIFSGGFLFLLGCSSLSPSSEEPDASLPKVDSKLERTFEQGLNELGAENYARAAKIFDSILVQNPASEFDLITLFNSAAAYEGLGNCTTAGKRYRQLAQTAAKNFPRIEAQALYRLSYAYECLGYPEKVVASLVDVKKRASFLPDETAKAEVPARLAAAYAQMGQIDVAKKYFDEAEAGIKQLRRTQSQRPDLPALLARTYFFMGRVQDRQGTRTTSDQFFQGLRFQQAYLIKAIEINQMPWSRKAADKILEAYRDMWTYMDEARKQAAKNSYQEERAVVLGWVESGLQALLELKTLRFPGGPESAESKRLFSQLDEEQRRMQEFLAEFATSHPLTPEAEKRQGLKREGRVKPTQAFPAEKQK